jgi:hypothetical protein
MIVGLFLGLIPYIAITSFLFRGLSGEAFGLVFLLPYGLFYLWSIFGLLRFSCPRSRDGLWGLSPGRPAPV